MLSSLANQLQEIGNKSSLRNIFVKTNNVYPESIIIDILNIHSV
jgi:hypothetical protein